MRPKSQVLVSSDARTSREDTATHRRPAKIGFFHFGRDYENPTWALAAALREADNPTSALIVLPEGFNLGVGYRAPGRRNFGRSVLHELRNLAKHYQTMFLSGLIIQGPCGPKPKRGTEVSSALPSLNT